MKNDEVRITPLGGLGEIGLNCQLWETAESMVMIDCGMMFPEDIHPGIDALIPHIDTIKKRVGKISGIILTHGHEDHIGALPWIIPLFNEISIYGSRFTLALARHKLEEHGLLHKVNLCPQDEGARIQVGDFFFQFLPVAHSIPQSYGLCVETPAGRIVHSGDFRLDSTGAELRPFEEFAGGEGALLLLSDSTNVMREGPSTTEDEVHESLDRIFAEAGGRIIITLFSSHIQRIQAVFDLADKYGREVTISGKSLATNIGLAANLGCLSLPAGFHNAFNDVPDLPPEKMVLIVTGAQGEPLAALSRMVLGNHKSLDILPGDTVVMSSRVIPGHTRAVSRLINEMYRLGAEVYYEGSHPVHASGHADAGQLVQLLRAVRPCFFLPVHGEYQHLVHHGRLAKKNGVLADNVICIEDGQPVLFSPQGYRLEERLPVESTLVDGKGVGDVGPQLLRERRILSEEGIVAVSLSLDPLTGALVDEPEIETLGVIFEPRSREIIAGAREIVIEEAEREKDLEKLRENLRLALRRHFRRLLDRDPMIIPLVQVNFAPAKIEEIFGDELE